MPVPLTDNPMSQMFNNTYLGMYYDKAKTKPNQNPNQKNPKTKFIKNLYFCHLQQLGWT